MKLWLTLFALSILAVAACGARTGLPVPRIDADAGAGGSIVDAGPDVVVIDAPPDVLPDVPVVDDCVDAGITYIYLIGQDNTLYRFYPPSQAAEAIGTIDCQPTIDTTATPYSMGVDRLGIAYVVFSDGELFRVSTATATCEATGFQIGQDSFASTFGMGFSANITDPGETLYVAGSGTEFLGSIDPTTFTLTPIGKFSTPIGEAELTGTGAGDLYAFGIVLETTDAGTTSTVALHLSQIDKPTAKVIGDTFVTLTSGSQQITDWAFAYWGGDFYFFTSTDHTSTIVSRYQPGNPTMPLPVWATIPSAIVGAGVSTCAPLQ